MNVEMRNVIKGTDAIVFKGKLEYLLKSSLTEVTKESLNAGQTQVRKDPKLRAEQWYVFAAIY